MTTGDCVVVVVIVVTGRRGVRVKELHAEHGEEEDEEEENEAEVTECTDRATHGADEQVESAPGSRELEDPQLTSLYNNISTHDYTYNIYQYSNMIIHILFFQIYFL